MATYPPRRLLGARPLPSDPRRDPRRSGFPQGGGGGGGGRRGPRLTPTTWSESDGCPFASLSPRHPRGLCTHFQGPAARHRHLPRSRVDSERERQREKVFLCRWFTLQWPLRPVHCGRRTMPIRRQEPGASPGLPWGAGLKHLGHPPLHSLATAESWPGRGATGTESGAPTRTRTWCAGAARWRISLLSRSAGHSLVWPGKAVEEAKVLGCLHPCGRPGRISWLLALD
ncbi:uncharacterized protein LOC133768569 isoform X2 [Lepus europaeus]|uniref:uncharacterized protein LOC133768569 isoform X2 n=1 Tax=Lepus europaeus TaxID=9983 RepID=UPI002B497BC2|nr:uncharacterized protein LOC133768569 isoform X2 [Lepus europaeus]